VRGYSRYVSWSHLSRQGILACIDVLPRCQESGFPFASQSSGRWSFKCVTAQVLSGAGVGKAKVQVYQSSKNSRHTRRHLDSVAAQ
jgi:hypothetical protein